MPTVIKRDGSEVPYDVQRISNAVQAAFRDTGERVSNAKFNALISGIEDDILGTGKRISVEQIQDIVEKALMAGGFYETAKQYILYREQHRSLRQRVFSDADMKLLQANRSHFTSDLQLFQYLSKYSRFDCRIGRRETWPETCRRVLTYFTWHMATHFPKVTISQAEWDELEQAMLKFEAFPSMRVMQMAGPALQRCQVGVNNCSYTAPRTLKDFADALYIMMQGTGLGYTVEADVIEELPKIRRQKGGNSHKFVVPDSTEGWCDSLLFGLEKWFTGEDVTFDFSHVRPAGTPLKTKGGRASGPDPLKELLAFSRKVILSRQGKRLRSIDVSDIMCKIGCIVEVGGVRRAAMSALSDLDDTLMRNYKYGSFWMAAPHRTMANISAIYEQRPDDATFMEEWLSLARGGTGERGIFNRDGLRKYMPKRRKRIGPLGMNPCVTADTWVMTATDSRGRSPGGAMQVKDLVDTSFFAMVDGIGYCSPTGFFLTGEKPAKKYILENGMSFTATDEHQVLVVSYQTQKAQRTEWKVVRDLRCGDRVVLHNHRTRTTVSWGGDGTFEEGWLLGSLFGDGNITADGPAPEDHGRGILEFWGSSRLTMSQLAVDRIRNAVGARADLGCATRGFVQTPPAVYPKRSISSAGLKHLAARCGVLRDDRTGGKYLCDTIESGKSVDFYCGFLRGWFDADGSVQGSQVKGVSVRLASSDLDALRRGQRMLARLGVISTIYPYRRPQESRFMPDGKGGLGIYECRADHELVISKDNLQVFAECVGFNEPAKVSQLNTVLPLYSRTPNRERFCSSLRIVEDAGVQPVYDCQVDVVHAFDANGCYLHNCGEVLMRPNSFCNLSIPVIRHSDSMEDIRRKVRLAAIFGTIQASMTNFNYIAPEWRANCEEERLLGVDLCGASDNPFLRPPGPNVHVIDARGAFVSREAFLESLRDLVGEVNREWAARLGINPSTANTVIKPGGNSSVLLGTGNAITGWHSPYIKRHVRVNAIDPMAQFLIDSGVPRWPEVGEADPRNPKVWAFAFPLAAPEGALMKDDLTAIEQLENWLVFKQHYTEHNPSVTIYVGANEWVEVGHWILAHWDYVGGIAFLAKDDNVYALAPNQTLTKAEYDEFVNGFPKIPWEKFPRYEQDDRTTLAHDLACVSGACAI